MKPFETRHDKRIKLCLVPLNLSESFLFGSRELCDSHAAVMVELNLAISIQVMNKKSIKTLTELFKQAFPSLLLVLKQSC